MAENGASPVKLQVANARPEEAGRGIARMPRKLLAALELAEGDIVEIVGKRSTCYGLMVCNGSMRGLAPVIL